MRTFLSLLALLAAALPAQARRPSGSFVMTTSGWSYPSPAPLAPVAPQTANGPAADALAQVNALRAARGLPAYQHDPQLHEAAKGCAAFRARHRIAGHTSSDFAFLPAGSGATAAGCAAWPAGSG